ncbi:MAG: TIGR03767 family metallophosphoesterase [Acidobacteria bacterium]|nr:TIGR03767 family metallophosphoesterase [Acidobacteriota bacterium]
MARISRRDFLRVGGAALAAGSVAPRLRWALSAGAATGGTTLDSTILKGALMGSGSRGSYYRLLAGPGEVHLLRTELAARAASPARRSLLHFARLTDTHIVDAQSPARVEFLDRYADPGNGCQSIPFSSAFRPQETLTLQVLEAMCRQVQAVGVSPVTAVPIAFAMCTGDNVDNEQYNELRWFIDLMDGSASVAANSGGPAYEGVQAAAWADQEYWHPDAGVSDKYKRQYGFPDYPGLLEGAVVPFTATGIGMPWYQTFGNHDGLLQGNVPRNEVFEAIAVSGLKVTGAPPGIDPCDSFEILRSNPSALLAAPARAVTPDTNRRILRRREYIEEHFTTTGAPSGHGFTPSNRSDGTAYYVVDTHPCFRLIALDTVNPGGYADGSIGRAQFDWLLARLAEVHPPNTDKLVILFSHHGLRSLSNPAINPDPSEPFANDLPRVMAGEIEAALHRFPNVIAWVNGHTHDNVVEPRPGGTGGFWDIGTAAHIDWSSQSRLVEVLNNGDGTLSILCTMVDHAGPVDPTGVTDPVLRLASIHREVAANDYQYGFGGPGRGETKDRNVELVIKAPFAIP